MSSSGAPAHRFLRPANALTYLSVASAVGAVVVALSLGDWNLAGILTAVSVLADLFDGRFARRFRRTPEEERFGVQLDSLADGVVFGMAPVACLLALSEFTSSSLQLSWSIAATVFILSALTRLGAYNLGDGGTSFIGLPTTMAGLVWCDVFLFRPSPPVSGLLLLLLAAAMVSPLRLPRPGPRGMIVLVACWAVSVALHFAQLLR